MQEAFNEYRDLRNGIDYSILKSLKSELQELELSLPTLETDQPESIPLKPDNRNRFVLLKVAAVVILLAVSAVVLFQLGQPSDPKSLFVAYFEPHENQFVSAKRGDDNATDPMIEAFQAYDNQDWETAINKFEEILAQKEDLMVLLYLGSAQLAQNDSKAAIINLQRFLETSKDSLSDAKWYLAMALLSEGRVEEARASLQELIADLQYGEDAKTILDKLE